jgi:parvulin-like peptidyl-prolyl isomerase
MRCKLLILFAALVMVMLFCASAMAGEKNIVLKVNDRELTENDLQAVMQRVLPSAIFHGGITEEKRERYRPQAMDMLLEDELLYQYALKIGMEVKASRLKDEVKATVKRLGGRATFGKALQQYGLTEDEYKESMARTILIQRVKSEEIDLIAIPLIEDVEEHYKKNKKMYKRPASKKLSHILLKVDPSATTEAWDERLEKAEELRDLILGGEPFYDVAWDNSDGPFKVKGGDLGVLHRGRLDPALEDAIWDLEEGELSEVVRTIYGFHIVRIEEIHEPQQLSLEDVSTKISLELTTNKKAALLNTILSDMKASSTIEMIKIKEVIE